MARAPYSAASPGRPVGSLRHAAHPLVLVSRRSHRKSMRIDRLTLADELSGLDVAVVIDVRDCSIAAHALLGGASRLLVAADARAGCVLRETLPGALLIGETPPFDLPASPAAVRAAELRGRTVLLATSRGTVAARRCAGARVVLAASFASATATVRWVLSQEPRRVTFVVGGEADAACADYLAERLAGGAPPPPPSVARARRSPPVGSLADLALCTALDAARFALVARTRDGVLELLRGRQI
jgi:2-phosphosulfolactate phosphatase